MGILSPPKLLLNNILTYPFSLGLILLFRIVAAAAFVLAGPTASTPASAQTPIVAVDHGLIDTSAFVEARHVAGWITGTNDNAGMAFMVIDKVNARLFLFDAAGQVRASTSVLLGRARGDDSPPGVGDLKLSAIKPGERITPAGRFVTHAGQDMDGKSVLWMDYGAAFALHRASDRKPGMSGMSRSQLLHGTIPAERRVSLGCINVSTSFYDRYIQPAFGLTDGVAYILPETRSAMVEFAMPATAG